MRNFSLYINTLLKFHSTRGAIDKIRIRQRTMEMSHNVLRESTSNYLLFYLGRARSAFSSHSSFSREPFR